MHNQGKQLGDGSLAVSCLHDEGYDFKGQYRRTCFNYAALFLV